MLMKKSMYECVCGAWLHLPAASLSALSGGWPTLPKTEAGLECDVEEGVWLT